MSGRLEQVQKAAAYDNAVNAAKLQEAARQAHAQGRFDGADEVIAGLAAQAYAQPQYTVPGNAIQGGRGFYAPQETVQAPTATDQWLNEIRARKAAGLAGQGLQ